MASKEEKGRAAAYVLRKMAGRGWDAQRLSDEAGLDIQTVRTFLQAKTWPQTRKRGAIEEALGLPAATIEMAARGMTEQPDDADPVEVAINQSELTRGDKATLIGTYYKMLDAQEGRRSS